MSKQADALVVLEEVAQSMKASAEEVTPSSSFDEGRLTGYYEALSTLLSQCKAFGIDPDEVGLAGFNPESLFTKPRKAA